MLLTPGKDRRLLRDARLARLAVLALALGACGGSSTPAYSSAVNVAKGIPSPPESSSAGVASLRDWPEFGLTPQRANATDRSPGITAASVRHLRRAQVRLPGTVDSSAIYLHAALVGGVRHDVAILTTTYGRTIAVDASAARILWTYTPPGYASWAASAQITNTTPLADPNRRYVYAAAPDGRIHRLYIADGHESPGGGWPVSLTRDPKHEKLASALNLDGPYLVATTGGYYGDAPPYVGHVALIDRASGRLVSVWNSLCANRRGLIVAATCSASGSAIWARAGAVVEPDGRLLVATGNAPYNGSTSFGDSVIELSVPALAIRQVFTPRDQAQLHADDQDLGSSAPALLPGGLSVMAGKDGILRVLRLSSLDGHPPTAQRSLGGEVQTLPTPSGAGLYTTPAVWRHGARTTLFVGDFSGTGAYVLRGGRLRAAWTNHTAGSSPVLAGGLLYVFDPNQGGVNVYSPGSPRPLSTLAGGAGHWNSPIVADGHVIEPEGNANDHAASGVVDVYSQG